MCYCFFAISYGDIYLFAVMKTFSDVRYNIYFIMSNNDYINNLNKMKQKLK